MSDDLRRVVAGALILRPALFEAVDVGPSDFPWGRWRKTIEVASELWEDVRPTEIDAFLLSERLGSNGAAGFISSLLSGAVRVEPDEFRRRVLELRRQNLTARIRAKLRDQDTLPEIDLSEIRPDLEALDRLAPSSFSPADVLVSGTDLQGRVVDLDYTVGLAVPARSINVLAGPGGGGKTFFAGGMANAVAREEPFLGLATKKRPVYYVDYENPLSLICERARKLNIQTPMFWHLSASTPPPKLDSPAYKLFFELPPGLLIIDTLRAAHDGDENSSQDMSLIMSRLKELREAGFDIFAIHHSPKANPQVYKGSSAISDLADHVIRLYRTRRSGFDEIQDDDEPGPELLDMIRGNVGEVIDLELPEECHDLVKALFFALSRGRLV